VACLTAISGLVVGSNFNPARDGINPTELFYRYKKSCAVEIHDDVIYGKTGYSRLTQACTIVSETPLGKH
jgi:hypothetical protein